MIPAGVILFVVAVIAILAVVAFQMTAAFRQQERGDRGHG